MKNHIQITGLFLFLLSPSVFCQEGVFPARLFEEEVSQAVVKRFEQAAALEAFIQTPNERKDLSKEEEATLNEMQWENSVIRFLYGKKVTQSGTLEISQKGNEWVAKCNVARLIDCIPEDDKAQLLKFVNLLRNSSAIVAPNGSVQPPPGYSFKPACGDKLEKEVRVSKSGLKFILCPLVLSDQNQKVITESSFSGQVEDVQRAFDDLVKFKIIGSFNASEKLMDARNPEEIDAQFSARMFALLLANYTVRVSQDGVLQGKHCPNKFINFAVILPHRKIVGSNNGTIQLVSIDFARSYGSSKKEEDATTDIELFTQLDLVQKCR